MKKFNWLCLTLFAFVFVACDDDDEGTLDTTAPTVSITSPAEGAEYMPGDVVSINFTVTDDLGLETITLMVNGTNEKTWDVDDFLNDDTNVTKDYELTIPENTTAGPYTISIDATDNAGNTATTVTRTITVMDQSQQAGISVTGIDEGAQIESVGNRTPFSFNVSDPEGVDSLNVNVTTESGVEISNQAFGGDFFSNVSDNTNFSVDTALNIPNVSAATGNQALTVNAFRGGEMVQTSAVNFVGAPMADAREVTFTVNVPATIPDTAQVVIAGDFQSPNAFRTDDPLYALTENEDGTWSGTFFVSGDMTYKYALLSEEGNDARNYRYVEKDATCGEISDRTYTFEGGEATVTDTVENFRNVGTCGD